MRNWRQLANEFVKTIEEPRRRTPEDKERKSYWHTHELVWSHCTKCKATLALDLLCLDGRYTMTYDQNLCHNHVPEGIIHDGLIHCGGKVKLIGGGGRV